MHLAVAVFEVQRGAEAFRAESAEEKRCRDSRFKRSPIHMLEAPLRFEPVRHVRACRAVQNSDLA